MPKKCDTCNTEDAKYTCPRCFTKSCSLKCCNIHKKEKACDGKKERTGFVDIKKFDDETLRSDYNFLRNVIRETDGAERDLRATKRRKISSKVADFKKKCQDRGVEVRIMPSGMKRRQINTSYFNKKENTVFWHIDWVFTSAIGGRLKVSSERVKETFKLRDIIESKLKGSSKRPGHASTQYRLKNYDLSKEGKSDDEENNVPYTVLMLKQTCNRDGKPVYLKMNPEACLCDILKNTILVEYPEFHVILKDDDALSLYQVEIKEKKKELGIDDDGGGGELPML